ncbi:MAG TPA: SDR family oxidoreductase [Solirubrobacterales bacterium]|nr:SDR family oxidoreductase [Solirubrobacterales bacterium]
MRLPAAQCEFEWQLQSHKPNRAWRRRIGSTSYSGIRVGREPRASRPRLGIGQAFSKDPDRAAKRLVHIPMGRFGEPDEIAKAALFLASDDSTFAPASTFLVDGGLSAAYLTPIQVD